MGPRAILAACARRGLSAAMPGRRGLGSQIALPPPAYTGKAVVTSSGVQVSPEDAAIANAVIGSVAAKYGVNLGISPFASGEMLSTMIVDNVYDPTLSGFMSTAQGCYTPPVLKAANGQPGTAQIVGQAAGIGGGLAAAILPIAGVAGPAAPFVALGAGLIGLFTALFQMHLKDMIAEQEAICPAMPAALQAFQAIVTAVQNGTVDAATGSAGLDSLVTEFSQAVQPQLHMSKNTCSAGCIYIIQLIACCAKMQYLWSTGQGVAQAGAQVPLTEAGALTPEALATNPVTGAVQSAANATGLPQAALWILGLFVIYQLA